MALEILYLGPEGTYTHQVAELKASRIKGAVDLVPKVSVDEVAYGVKEDPHNRIGVIAYYNYLEGLVQKSLDVIYRNDLRIVDAERLYLTICAGSIDGQLNEGPVYSHEKALDQCPEWLHKYLPNAPRVAVGSTAAGAKKVGDEGKGIALASRKAIKRYGLEMIKEGTDIIGDDVADKVNGVGNHTDFYVVTANGITPGSLGINRGQATEYMTMLAIRPETDEPKLLYRILGEIDHNLATIHSRPLLCGRGDDTSTYHHQTTANGSVVRPQMFYMEIMAGQDDPKLNGSIARITDILSGMDPASSGSEVVRVLGSYEMLK